MFKYKFFAKYNGLEVSPVNAILHHAARSVIYTPVSDVQTENAHLPMLVTLAGIVTVVSDAQLKNAHSQMLVPPVMTTVVKESGMLYL